MMSKPQVTILVAVWNTAAYLPQCLESLRRQTLRNIQVVCVDDASTDESLAVLRHYADLDERIEVVALPKTKGRRMPGTWPFAKPRENLCVFLIAMIGWPMTVWSKRCVCFRLILRPIAYCFTPYIIIMKAVRTSFR